LKYDGEIFSNRIALPFSKKGGIMRKIFTERQELLCYLAVYEFGLTEQMLAELLNVSQATISNAIRNAKNKLKHGALERELANARKELSTLLDESKIVRLILTSKLKEKIKKVLEK